MSVDVEAMDEASYNRGYDDGYMGRDKRSDDPDYVEGYYDGMNDGDGYDDYVDDVFSDWD